MKTQHVKIKIQNDESVSAVIAAPDQLNSDIRTGLIFAHGAGNDMNNPLIVSISEGLTDKGFMTIRFNFLYKEKGRKAPDSQKVLINTWIKVYNYFKYQSGYAISDVVAVGKSMGGRVASQMVADGQLDVSRLIFLGYPLHASGKTDKLRDAHLYNIKIPMLFFAGTRDTLCNLDKLRSVLKNLSSKWELDIIEGGDHSFKLLKSDPKTDNDIYQHIIQKSSDWLTR